MATRNGSSHPDSLIARSDQTAPAAILVAQATSPASPPQGADAPPSAAPQTVAFALGNDGAARLPVGTDLGNPRQDGANLEFVQPDGSVIIIVGGAISGLIVFIGEVEIPAMTVAAMFSANGIETAAGPDTGPDDGSARFARLVPQATDLEPHNPGSDKSGQSALLGNTELQTGRDDNGQADNWQPNEPNEHGDAPPVIDADDAGGAPDSADAAGASEQTDEDIPFTGSAVGLVLPDADGLAVTGSYAMASDPLHGSITLNADTGAYTYTPAKDYSGADSFSFAVVDGLGNASAPATVRIDIAPIADGAVINVPVIYPVPSGGNSVVNTDVSSNPRNPSVAAIDGGYVVTWSSYGQDGSDSGVYAQRYSSDGTRQGDETQVNTYVTFSQEFPSVAAIDGGYVVTWTSLNQDGSGYGVYAQRYLSDGTRQGHETQVNTYVTGTQYDSSVAAIDGGYIVTWTSQKNQGGSDYGVYSQRYLSDGTRQGHETQVNTYVTGNQYDSSVAAIDGGYIVTWTSLNQDGSDHGVYSQRFLSDGTPQGDETQVNTYVTGNQHDSSLAAIDGGYIVTWSSYGQDGSISSVYAQRYSSDGTPQGDETQVNTYVANIQSNSSVAAIDGGYVVTWTSDGQDGSVSGLYSQRYLTDGSPLGSEFRVDAGDGIYAITGKVALTSDGVLVAVWDAGRDIEQRLFQRPAQISGDGDSAITHSRLWFDLPDGDGSEAITSVVLSGYPAGQTFSLGLAGTGADAGKWIIDAASDIARAATGNLTMTSPDHYGVDFTLTITANVTDNAMLSSGSVTSSTSSSATFTNLIETNLIETDLAADITSSGTLVASNIGTTQGFVAQFGVAGTYGTFSINTSGAWGYTASSAHDEFAAGATYTDRFAVTTADGTATSVTANILGTNDAPAITGDLSASMVRGSSYTLTTTDLNFTDPDDNGAGVTFTVSSLVNGAVRVSGDVVTSFTGEQLAAGVVSFGHTGSNTTAVSFSVMVEDGNEDISTPVSRLFNMTVTPPPRGGGGSRFVADPVADHVGGDGVPSDLAATAVSLTLLPITALDTSSGISFSFQTSDDNAPGFSPYSVAQQAAAITALGLWAETAGLSIYAAAEGETGTIQFANWTSIDYAQFNANAGSDGGTIWTNPGLDLTLQLAPGDYGFLTLLHETGHALGLEHAHDLTQLGTVMAYAAPDGIGVDWWSANGVWVNPQTPMVSDIATLQAAYGADTTTRADDTVYGFNATADQEVFDFTANADPVLTIYDAGGTDTIDLSGYDTPALIDLTPGSSSSANGMTHNIGIAFGTVIENAIGGSGDDIIIGNDAANILTGGAGDDVLIGNLGADTLTGGAGTDTFELDTLDASDLITDFQTGADGDIIDLSGLLDGLANREDAVRLRYADGSEHSLVEAGAAVAVDGDVALDVNTGGGWNEVAVLQDNGDNLTTGLDSIRIVLDDITGAQSFDI